MVHTLTATTVRESIALLDTKFSTSLISEERQGILHCADVLRPRNLHLTDQLYPLSSTVELFNLTLSHAVIPSEYSTILCYVTTYSDNSMTVTCKIYIRSFQCLLAQIWQ